MVSGSYDIGADRVVWLGYDDSGMADDPSGAGHRFADADLEEAAARVAAVLDEEDADVLTSVIYGVPKLALGLGLDDAPTDEVKAGQKAFFTLLYNLLVAAERGPRLPTLFAALGPEKVRSLLAG